MLNPLVLAAIVALVKAIADAYFPQFPISEELIYTLIVALLGLFGLEVVKAGVQKFAPKLVERGLIDTWD
jgi:hypothetical protein